MDKEKKIVKGGVRTFKFSNGNNLNYKVTLPCVITDIVTDYSDIRLLLSKDSMKIRTCFNFENDSVTMFKKKFPMRYTLSGHYHIPITKYLLDKSKFTHILSIKEISSKNKSEKIKIATKLRRQFPLAKWVECSPMVWVTWVQPQVQPQVTSYQRL